MSSVNSTNMTISKCVADVNNSTLALTFLSCILSILGSFMIFFTFAKLPQTRNLLRKLLLALTVADFFTAAGNLIGSIRYASLAFDVVGCKHLKDSDIVCVMQSFITTYSSMASFFWTTVIAFHIFINITRRSEVTNSRSLLLGYSAFCYLVPGVIIITAAAMRVLGSDNIVGTGSWCWIRSGLHNEIHIIWMLMTGKFWEVLCYILTAALYILSKLKLKLESRSRPRHNFNMADIDDMRIEDENFLWVPLILYFLRIWGTLRFFLAVTQRHMHSVVLNTTQEVLLAFQSIGDSGQAFWNCVLFCFCDRTIRTYLVQIVRCRNSDQLYEEPNERTPIQT